MLAKIAPASNDFHALARYLVSGRPGTTPNPNRVAWTYAQNLPTNEPDLAATYMQATAQLSARIRNAAYHLMIAWHERERPDAELMQTVARRTLELAGLAEHQALFMGHGDTPHRHLHILLNRVHPDTGRAWKTSQDFARFDGIMKQLAAERGCEHAPAHAFNPDATEATPKKPNSRATRAGKNGAPTQRLQWSRKSAREFGSEISQDLTQSSTWDDVEMAFADRGLALEKKGRGLVVGNAFSYAKISNLRLQVTAKGAPHYPPLTFGKRRRCVFTVDEIDIVRALMTLGITDRDDLTGAIREKAARRAQRLDAMKTQATQKRLTEWALMTTALDRSKPARGLAESLGLQSTGPLFGVRHLT